MMSCLIQDVCVLYAVKGHWVGSVEWMQLVSQRPWKVELKSMTVDPTSELRSHQFSFWGATCGIGYRRGDFEISLRLVAFCWMHPFASIFIFWFVGIASLRGFVSCQGKSAGFQAKAMWRRSGMWFGPCHGAIPRETCALLWRCASENDLFCSFAWSFAWHCLCAWMRSSLVLHLTVSAKIAFGMRGRCLKKVARSSNSKQTSNLDALCPWTRRSEWSQCSKPCDGGQTQVNSDKSQRRKKHRNTKQNGTGTCNRKRLYHVAVTSLCFKDSWTCRDPNTKEGLQGVRSAGTLKHRQG